MVERVLVPMDDSPLARRALEYALEVHPDATITVLHVVDYVEDSYGAELLLGPDELRERAEARAESVFETARETVGDRGTAVETVTRYGDPARAITRFVDEESVDVVVLGGHGRSLLSRVLLGSVAASVVRRASVPVTVVR